MSEVGILNRLSPILNLTILSTGIEQGEMY
jgi:hypothetical protein